MTAIRMHRDATALARPIAQIGHLLDAPERTWIDYRASRATAATRTERGDDVPTCPDCRCELDVSPVPHSPRCKGRPQPATPTRAVRDHTPDQPTPVSEAPFQEALVTEPAPLSRRVGRPPLWTREKVLDVVQRLGSDGVAPTGRELAAAGPSPTAVKRLFGSHLELVEAAGLTAKPRSASQTTHEPAGTSDAGIERVNSHTPDPTPEEPTAAANAAKLIADELAQAFEHLAAAARLWGGA